MAVIELKPCPWCGSDAVLVKRGVGRYFVSCGNEDCDVRPALRFYFKRKAAIEAWNRRVSDEK